MAVYKNNEDKNFLDYFYDVIELFNQRIEKTKEILSFPLNFQNISIGIWSVCVLDDTFS